MARSHIADILVFMQRDRHDIAFQNDDPDWHRRVLNAHLLSIAIDRKPSCFVIHIWIVKNHQRLIRVIIIIDVGAFFLIQARFNELRKDTDLMDQEISFFTRWSDSADPAAGHGRVDLFCLPSFICLIKL